MKFINQSIEILDWGAESGVDILKKIERIGRTAYKSEDKITETSSENFVKGLIKSGHHSVIEHHNITVKFITNRGVTHELVRHRLCAFTQESTRYVKYSDNMNFILPVWYDKTNDIQKYWFEHSCKISEDYYTYLIENKWKAQQAREVLPNSLKTEIVVTTNLREWRHIFNLRCAPDAHPQIRELMKFALIEFYKFIPCVFEDLYQKYIKD